jgi:hypothetical protein
MVYMDCKEITYNCLKLALNDLTQVLCLYEQEQYLSSEKKLAEVIYRSTSALHFISREREEEQTGAEL